MWDFLFKEGVKMRKKLELKRQSTSKRFDEGYDEFILNCKVRNLRPTTIKYYDDMVNIWYKFLPDYKIQISEITKETIDSFIIFLETNMNMNDVTINTVVRGMKSILNYFMKLEYMERFVIPKLKEDRKIIETYSAAELKILLEKPNLDECNFLEYRNYVIINFLISTGARARTVVNIKIQDLDFDNNLLNYGYTKNRKQQIVPMGKSLKVILMEYLVYRKGMLEDYLFVNAYGDVLTVSQLGHNLNDYNRRRGIMKTGLHRFRHSFAKLWIQNGGDIFKLQKILSHSTLDMVKNYVNMFADDLQKDFNTFNPLEQFSVQKKHIKLTRK